MIIMGNCRVCVLVEDNVGIPPIFSLATFIVCPSVLPFFAPEKKKKTALIFPHYSNDVHTAKRAVNVFFFRERKLCRAERIQFRRSLIRGRGIFFQDCKHCRISHCRSTYTVDDSQPAIKCSYEIRIFFLFSLLEP